jgi:hypothetical protein
MAIRITDIDWDTEGEAVDLPSEVVVDPDHEGIGADEEALGDWLSDRYGWAVKGFATAPADEPGTPAP